MSSNLPPKLKLLLLLDAYEKHQILASMKLRKCFLQLSKARRSKMSQSLGLASDNESSELSASRVREELLYPRATIVVNNGCDNEKLSRYWRLIDPIDEGGGNEKVKKMEGNTNHGGLRQRQGIELEGENTENNNNCECGEKLSDDDEVLRKANPIDLFGAFPPRDLRKAQKEAQNALEYYINTANLATAILKVMNNND
mmetsp:Transcript_41633/g.47309  ORF Transcript_41633/g.47309 Transcript_41633/m.47309 type:complete len:199 (-) Transcript_41633:104-700(-)